MKKNLLTIGLLALSFSAQAQILTHVDNSATFYVGDGALVYNGGGLQTKGSGLMDVHGNVMVVGTGGTDKFRCLDASGVALTTPGDNIILRLNDPSNYANSTYGQLYITGLSQTDITGFVTKEYKDKYQGTFQQIAIPFAEKTFTSFASDLGKSTNTFAGTRTADALAYNDNTKTVMRVAAPGGMTDGNGVSNALYGPTTYFAAGTGGSGSWTPELAGTAVKSIKGKPFTDMVANVTLLNGGAPGGTPIWYGSSGEKTNEFGEWYRSYLNDPFDTRWTGTYAKELYQYGNPFLTNIDLSLIATEALETGTNTDGNKLPVKGIRFSQSQISFVQGTGTTTTVNNYVTFAHSANGGAVTPAGDVDKLIIKPMGAVYIKLDPTLMTTYSAVGYTRVLNFNTLRRFSMKARAASTSYSVTAAKTANPATSLKQLGVIALDANNQEIGRTYYVVSATRFTGYTTTNNIQANTGYNSNNVPLSTAIFTNEEYVTGGIDPTYSGQYNLYINEANETDFIHKKIPLNVYSSNVSKLKFEIREDAVLINDGQQNLSSGESFWINVNGTNTQLAQNQIITIGQGNYGLYYGQPQADSALAVNDVKNNSTVVAFEKETGNFVVIFDRNWKKADVSIYDMSGKLISAEKGVKTTQNHILNISKALNNAYLVVITADNGDVYKTKIMR